MNKLLPLLAFFPKRQVPFNADIGKEIGEIWDKIPSDLDVLLTHTPPRCILDFKPS